jgi:hypothetical protein
VAPAERVPLDVQARTLEVGAEGFGRGKGEIVIGSPVAHEGVQTGPPAIEVPPMFVRNPSAGEHDQPGNGPGCTQRPIARKHGPLRKTADDQSAFAVPCQAGDDLVEVRSRSMEAFWHDVGQVTGAGREGCAAALAIDGPPSTTT